MLESLLPDIMKSLEGGINSSQIVAWLVMAVSFAILAKSADIFVDSAVTFATKFNISKLVIGLVLVSFATTAPELCVSLMAALKGNPEMALGNAIGSVICDDGLAMGCAGLFAVSAIAVTPAVLRSSGIFLIIIQVVAFLFVFRDFTLSSGEGLVLVGMFFVYLVYMFREHKKGRLTLDDDETSPPDDLAKMSVWKVFLLFFVGLCGIIFASEFIILSATSIAVAMRVPESVIALTLVALGTSIPEVATCVIAAKKGHGQIAVGNILGADILNIAWVAGASSLANNLTLDHKQIYFMFPAMFVMVAAMLLMLRHNHSLTKTKGIILLVLYFIYIVATVMIFPPSSNKTEKTQSNNKQRGMRMLVATDAESAKERETQVFYK
jgi:cation:H+ antiporter